MGGKFQKAITNPYQIKRAAVLCSIRVGTAACLRGKLGKTVFTNEGAVEFGERALDGERSANRAFESFYCAIGCPNNAISPSPSFLATRPPICVTAPDAASR